MPPATRLHGTRKCDRAVASLAFRADPAVRVCRADGLYRFVVGPVVRLVRAVAVLSRLGSGSVWIWGRVVLFVRALAGVLGRVARTVLGGGVR